MVKISAGSIAIASLSILLLVPSLTAQSSEQAAASREVSKVRIVRLSEVKGEVQLDRGIGRGFETATANLPIIENCRLRTRVGVAEVEFEDNSSLRLGPDSEVDFPTLGRMANGATLSSVRVVRGIAYVSLMKTPKNEFNLLFGQQTLELPASSHVRLQLDGSQASLAVLGGAVQIKSSEGLVDVPHKRTVTFALAGPSEPTVARSVESNPLDVWDHSSDEYHARVATASAFNGTPYAYGLSDMMYYGDFASLAGCGMMWRPYFASAAWDPYSNGAWAWYGTGYSWVSPYPWGWTPYHYGAWSFCPGAGWGWMPGGSWMGVNNTAVFSGLKGPITIPKLPVHPPRPGAPTLLLVNQRPLIQSQPGSSSSFVFRRDSAGLGIPRDELGRLNRFSQRADARGMASTPIYMEVPVAEVNGRETLAGVPSIRRGIPPSGDMGRPEMGGQRGGPNAFTSHMSNPSMSTGSMAGPSISSPSMSRGSMSAAPSGGSAAAPSGGHPR